MTNRYPPIDPDSTKIPQPLETDKQQRYTKTRNGSKERERRLRQLKSGVLVRR